MVMAWVFRCQWLCISHHSPIKLFHMKNAIFCLMLLLSTAAFQSNGPTILTGKILDAETGETLIGANVLMTQNGKPVRGVASDYDGIYRLQLTPGTYDVEVSYTGYTSEKRTGVLVQAGQTTNLDFSLKAGTQLTECVVVGAKVQILKKDQTSCGYVVQPAKPEGKSKKSKKAGKEEEVNIRGARTQSNNYYIDGVRVSGSAPETARAARNKNHAPADTIAPPEATREQYNEIVENPFFEAKDTPVSTFSIDVDGAAYANVRRFLDSSQLPPRDAVRIEEMLNYFDYQYDTPKNGDPFAVTTELGECPWQPGNQLLMIAMKGREMDFGQLPPGNFVFLVDVSGSMGDPNKLPLVQQSLSLLLDQLRPEDRVALTVYAGAAGLVLPSTPASQKETIRRAIQNLSAGGSTAGGAGIQLAYKVAQDNFAAGGNNRVILCTDGDFNVGVNSEGDLTKLIENERESGVYLTVLGFGMGNYQEGKMQTLADKGNGNHAYIDGLDEAKKVLVREFGGTMYAIAKDVKLQLHFNPAAVASYRLIGYENRVLAKEDFDNDAKDAGELGAGHRVTALYEIVPVRTDRWPVDLEKTAEVGQREPEDLMTLRLRYKPPTGKHKSRLIEKNVSPRDLGCTGDNFLLASAVAEFGLLLRDSKHKGHASWAQARARAAASAKNFDPDGYRQEMVRLIDAAEKLSNLTASKK